MEYDPLKSVNGPNISMLLDGFRMVRTGGGISFEPVRQNLSADWRSGRAQEHLYDLIYSAIEELVSAKIDRAFELALQKVPVRQVQKGGRATFRARTARERLSDRFTIYRFMSPSERATLLSQSGNNVKRAIQSISVANKVVVKPNKNAVWGNPGKGDYEYASRPGRPSQAPPRRNARRLRLVGQAEFESNKRPFPAGGTLTRVDDNGVIRGDAHQSGMSRGGKITGARYVLDDKGNRTLVEGTGYLTWDSDSPIGQSEFASRDRNLNAEGRRMLRRAKLSGSGSHMEDESGGLVANRNRGDSLNRGIYFDMGGTLRDSIKKVSSPENSSKQISQRVQAGSRKAYYAIYMEMGTRYVAARPFLRPALAEMEKGFRSQILTKLKSIGIKVT